MSLGTLWQPLQVVAQSYHHSPKSKERYLTYGGSGLFSGTVRLFSL